MLEEPLKEVEIIAKQRSERFRRLSKEGFWIILGQALTLFGSIVGVRVLTGMLNPAAYGELALAVTVATLISQTIFGPLGNGVMRFYAPAVEHGDFPGYLLAVTQLVITATWIIFVLIPCAAAVLFFVHRGDLIVITSAALLFALVSGYNSVLTGIQSASRQRAIVALHQAMEAWVRFLFAAALLACFGARSGVAMAAYAISALAVLTSQFLFFRKRIALTDSGDGGQAWRQQIWRYSWPFSAWGIFGWAQQSADRWALQIFGRTSDVGLYTVLFQLGYYPISIAIGMAMQFLAPIFYERSGDTKDIRRQAAVSNLSRRLMLLTLAATAAAFLLGSEVHAQVFAVFLSKDYARMSYLLPWMILAGGIFAAGQTVALNLMTQMRTQAMAVAKISTAVLGVAFTFLGAYWYKTPGVVIAAVSFSVLYLLWMVVVQSTTRIEGQSPEQI